MRPSNNINAELNSGFGTNAQNYGGRFLNRDGTANVKKSGIPWFERFSWYHVMLDLSGFKFFVVLFLSYLILNLFFALLYYSIGIEHLNGINPNATEWRKFGKAFFFSTQTFTTVGYGHISPNGFLTSALAALEALVGLLSFAIATGLFFGRFSRPRVFIRFSDNALIAPYRGERALMIRLVPYKNTNLSDAHAKLTLGIVKEENGKRTNKFYQLHLELDQINSLTLSWTLVHPIDEQSPLYNFTAKDYQNLKGEFLVFIKTFDEMFSTTVGCNTSYIFSEIVYGAQFDFMYSQSKDHSKTILHLNKLSKYSNVAL